MPSVDTPPNVGSYLGPPRLSTSLLVAEYKCRIKIYIYIYLITWIVLFFRSNALLDRSPSNTKVPFTQVKVRLVATNLKHLKQEKTCLLIAKFRTTPNDETGCPNVKLTLLNQSFCYMIGLNSQADRLLHWPCHKKEQPRFEGDRPR